jgi:hypothetical protein
MSMQEKGCLSHLRAQTKNLNDASSHTGHTSRDDAASTCTFVARFDLATNAPSLPGAKTVEVLQLDRREALEAGYRKTHKRILAVAERALGQPAIDANEICEALRDADDHGLLGWHFSGTGQSLSPFRKLRTDHPLAWAACVEALA